MAKIKKCRVRGCNNEAEHKESGLCKKCYAFMYYWNERSVTDKMKRIDQLEFWQKRANQLLLPQGVRKLRTG